MTYMFPLDGPCTQLRWVFTCQISLAVDLIAALIPAPEWQKNNMYLSTGDL